MNLPTQTKSSASLLMQPESFDQMYRVGKMLASSVLFPEHLRKGTAEQAAANGALVMNMAMRLNEDPLTVAQNIYFVGGKPGWSSSYMIAKANQHGVFKNPISWEITGSGDDLSITAFAELEATGKKVTATCDMAMAKAEGWTKNSKYKSMPEQMLRYRSATFLIRLYCPEVMVGVPSQIEVELDGGMKDVIPAEFREQPEPKRTRKAATTKEAEIVEEPAAPAQEELPEEPEAAKNAPVQHQENQPDPEQFGGLVDLIKNDLMDSPDIDAVLELYADQIVSMKTAAPDAYAALQKDIEAFRAGHGAA